jgi:uncharacterized tellurite resistance protein B-like protein
VAERPRSPGSGGSGTWLTGLAGVSLFLPAALPLLWLATELRAQLSGPPTEGFGLTDAEWRTAREAHLQRRRATDALVAIESLARRHQCTLLPDGTWDERDGIARTLNSRKATETDAERTAQRSFDDAVAGPSARFDAWASPRRTAWAMRGPLVLWVTAAALRPTTVGLGSAQPNTDWTPSSVLFDAVTSGHGLFVALVVLCGLIGDQLGGAALAEGVAADGNADFRARWDAEPPPSVPPSLPETAEIDDAPRCALDDDPVAAGTIALLKRVVEADGPLDDDASALVYALLRQAFGPLVPDLDAHLTRLVEQADASFAACSRHLEQLRGQDRAPRIALVAMALALGQRRGPRGEAMAMKVASGLRIYGPSLDEARTSAAAIDLPRRPVEAAAPADDRATAYAALVVGLLRTAALADGPPSAAELARIGAYAREALAGALPESVPHVDWALTELDIADPGFSHLVAQIRAGADPAFRASLHDLCATYLSDRDTPARRAVLLALRGQLGLEPASGEPTAAAAR